MFLVGGFSESPVLQVEMRKEFCHLLKIIIPQDVALTILKGLFSSTDLSTIHAVEKIHTRLQTTFDDIVSVSLGQNGFRCKESIQLIYRCN